MSTINQLTASSPATAGMQIPLYDPNQGDARKISLTTLLAFLQGALAFPSARPAFVTQYAAPVATGFDVQITDGADDDGSVHLILTPAAGYANGEVTLPLLASCVDKQEVLVNCTQAVAAFVVDGNGATVAGAPVALLANEFFLLKFDATLSTWYRVG